MLIYFFRVGKISKQNSKNENIRKSLKNINTTLFLLYMYNILFQVYKN